MSGKPDSGVIGGRIDVYEDRVSGWLLRPIRTLLETRDSHFAALSLALSYFEGWAQYGMARSVSTPGVRFIYRLASRLASVHPAA